MLACDDFTPSARQNVEDASVKVRSVSRRLRGSNVLRQITNQLTFPVITVGARRSSATVLGIVRVTNSNDLERTARWPRRHRRFG